MKAACGLWTDDDVLAPKCQAGLAEMNTKVGQFDVYNVYDTCGGNTMGEGDASSHRMMTYSELVKRMSAKTVSVNDSTSPLAHPQLQVSGRSLGDALNDYPCGGDKAVSQWLSQSSVADALHVKPGTRGMNYTWG